MKHAVLIMAHKNKAQLKRLIEAVACANFDIFVHPDSQWSLNADDIAEIEGCAENVFVTKNRIHGELDRWSLVQIALNLIDEAAAKEKAGGESYSYFLLLSGQDYPIKSKEYILSFLEEQYPKPLIHCDSYEDEYWVRSKFMLVKWEHRIDDLHKRLKSGLGRKLRVLPCVIAEKAEDRLYGSPHKRLSRFGLKLSGGSAWWILPHGVIDYINRTRQSNKAFIKEYKRTWTPEETFFQTMTINSPFADYMIKNDSIYEYGERTQQCMTYANFVTETKPFNGHPHVITSEDFEEVMSKKALFARKFDTELDAGVLDMIDKRLQG